MSERWWLVVLRSSAFVGVSCLVLGLFFCWDAPCLQRAELPSRIPWRDVPRPTDLSAHAAE